MLNQCDVTYKQSSNKRLLVELTLIEVAQLTQPDDGVSAGRGPKRLKILFKRLIDSQDKAAVQVAAGEKPLVRNVKAAAPQADSVQPSAAAPAAIGASAASAALASSAAMGASVGAAVASSTAASASSSTASSASTATVSAGSAAAKGMPRLKLGSLGMTFAGLKQGDREEARKEEEENTKGGEAMEFTEEDLSLEWLRMCNRMPPNMVGLASRMKNMTPHITSWPEVEVLADNQLLLDQIEAIKGRIRATLAAALHNSDIKLKLRLAKQEEKKPVLTKLQIFDKMKADFEPFARLVETLGLQLN